MQFTFKDELLNENDLEESYRRRKDDEKKSVSYGQRKLLFSLISFLLKHCMEIKNPVIVYAGAAVGINIGLAADLFPQFEWHLYDPAKFLIKTDLQKKIIIYRKKFDDNLAEYWAEKNRDNQNIIFISDIRTADYTKAKDLNENEIQIQQDMEMQRRWVEIIKPIRTQLKFRPPYADAGVNEDIEYFSGLIYKQAWAPQTSTETRLVLTSPELSYRKYDCRKYQSQLFYHNVVVRETFKYENEYMDGLELLNDWDSCCEVNIWKEYLNYMRQEINKENILKLCNRATQYLNKDKKEKDTLSYLRSHPRAIKDRNFNKKHI